MDSLTADAPARKVVVGVDTHKERHVAVALDGLGTNLGHCELPATAAGYAAVRRWAEDLGTVESWGIEGATSYGTGLACALRRVGHAVVEVERPERRARRGRGKSDPLDAELAARAALAGRGTVAKSADGPVEVLRITRAARSSAVKARTAAMNQLKAVLVTAPAPLRAELEGRTTTALVRRCAGLRPGGTDPVSQGVRRTLRALARRWLVLDEEAREHGAELARLVRARAPRLVSQHGVGPDTAASLLIAAGDNPQRLRSSGSFAALCGTSPIEANSGRITGRHRLNRGGDRQANAALHRIIVVRLGSDPETRAYVAARVLPNGANKRHLMRCLKRSLARRLFSLVLEAASQAVPPASAGEAA